MNKIIQNLVLFPQFEKTYKDIYDFYKTQNQNAYAEAFLQLIKEKFGENEINQAGNNNLPSDR